MRVFNLQDPTNFLPKTQPTTKSIKPARTIMDQYKNNQFVQKFLGKAFDPASPDSSDDEDSEVSHKKCVNDKLEKEIEALFMSVKEECERDRIMPEYDSEDEIEAEIETEKEQAPKVSIPNSEVAFVMLPSKANNVINREKVEQKGGITFVIRSSGPSKYFKPLEKPKKHRKRRRTRKNGNKRILNLLSLAVTSGLSFKSDSFDYCNLAEILELSKIYVGFSQEN